MGYNFICQISPTQLKVKWTPFNEKYSIFKQIFKLSKTLSNGKYLQKPSCSGQYKNSLNETISAFGATVNRHYIKERGTLQPKQKLKITPRNWHRNHITAFPRLALVHWIYQLRPFSPLCFKSLLHKGDCTALGLSSNLKSLWQKFLIMKKKGSYPVVMMQPVIGASSGFLLACVQDNVTDLEVNLITIGLPGGSGTSVKEQKTTFSLLTRR